MRTQIIAECGINACGSLDNAKFQMDEAAMAGCDAVKFQVYDTDRLYNGNKSAPSYKDSEKGRFSYDDLRKLADYSPLPWFAAPFDTDAVALLESIGVDRYKVATRSVADEPLLKAIAKTDKPVYMSIGRHAVVEIERALDILKDNDVTLLYCVPDYPTSIHTLDFEQMTNIPDIYGKLFGFSDHTMGIWASIEAVRLGATVIEKHFTTSRDLPGCDQICSLEPQEMKLLVKSIRQYENFVESHG